VLQSYYVQYTYNSLIALLHSGIHRSKQMKIGSLPLVY